MLKARLHFCVALLLMKCTGHPKKKIFSNLSLKEKEAVDTKLFHAVQQGLGTW